MQISENLPRRKNYLGLALLATSLKYDVGVLSSQKLLVGNELSHQLREGQCVRHVSLVFCDFAGISDGGSAVL